MSDGLTAEQRVAVDTLDADVCVAAGAGAGKTRVLVERFLRLALGEGRSGSRQSVDAGTERQEAGTASLPVAAESLTSHALRPPTAVDEILAITFTRKAALEMKERIARALVARGLVEERRQLEVGYISTIHTFCERVLRENPFEAGLDPAFAVLDDPEAALLLDEAYEQVLEAAFAREEDPVAGLVQACYDRRTREGEDGVRALRNSIVDYLHALSSLGWSPDETRAWVREPLERFLARSVDLLVHELNPVLATFRESAAVLAGLSLERGVMEENRVQLVAGAAALEPLDAPAAGEPDRSMEAKLAEIEARLGLLSGLRGCLRATGPVKGVDPRAYETARERLTAMREAYEGIQKWATDWCPEQERRAQSLARAGLELLARLWERYERLKRERAALDFGDLQRLTRDLLRDSPPVRARLRARLKYMMVDEFQDTDRLQAELLDLLRGERNLFFVGDARQSIYRFRHADVRLFREREHALREAEARDPATARRLALATNFRSRPEILAFVNALFEHLWRPQEPAPPPSRGGGREGGPAPDPASLIYEPLCPGRAFDAKPIPCIDLLTVPAEGGADAVRRTEAVRVAQRVRDLLAGEVAITRSDHPERGRPYRPADVVVLMRTTRDVALYEQALGQVGLSTFVVGGRNYYARREIRDVVNFLKTISHPTDDLAVASTLRSPFVGVSLDTLTLLSLQSRRQADEAGSFYGAIAAALESQPIEPDDAERLRAYTALVERLRGQEDRFRGGEILEIALAESDYVVEVLRRPGGRRTLANVRKLLQMANARAGGAMEFVQRIESLTRVSDREGEAPTHAETDDVVRLMTIHQAKGLEFPVVVLPDLGRGLPPSRLPLLALDPDRRAVAFRSVDGDGCDPPLHHALATVGAAAEQEEHLRLLYVALTRAEEHLVLAGPHPARPRTWAHLLWQHLPPDAVSSGRAALELFEARVRVMLFTSET